MKSGLFYRITSIFVLCCILFVPFPFYLFPYQVSITESLFGNLIVFFSKTIFNKPLTDTHVHSDTTSMYVLVFLLFLLSVIVGSMITKLKGWNAHRDKITRFIYLLACYYLALQLLKYGLDKVFKNQFYLPEPNTLFTPMGKVPRDLLYWSSMGTSHFYNVFLGIMEVIAAVFIILKRTRLLGLLLSLFIVINIVAVNFGFDISVKLYSLLLLFLTAWLLIPFLKPVYDFFFRSKPATATQPGTEHIFSNPFLSGTLMFFAAGIILVEAFYPFVRSGNFNGDNVKKPELHGAYQVTEFIRGADTLDVAQFPVRRFFIHKDSYMIFQNSQDEMADYKLVYDVKMNDEFLVDYKMNRIPIELDYQAKDSILTIAFSKDGQTNRITGKVLDWKKMPAMKKEFHWTID